MQYKELSLFDNEGRVVEPGLQVIFDRKNQPHLVVVVREQGMRDGTRYRVRMVPFVEEKEGADAA